MDGDCHKGYGKPVDRCHMTPYERQKVKDAWLAVPKCVPTQVNDVPSLVRRTPFGLSVPALRAKCSPHTEMLAMAKLPLPQMHYVTQAEKELQKELEEEMTKEEKKWLKRVFFSPTPTGVKKTALSAKTTPRLEAMALAKLPKREDTYREPKKRCKRKCSMPSHFPLPEKSRFLKPKTPRVCGCAEFVKRKFFGKEDV